jgi:hypothetical protein
MENGKWKMENRKKHIIQKNKKQGKQVKQVICIYNCIYRS